MKDLTQLLRALDPAADLADRHVWLIKLFEWIRGDQTSVQAAVARVQAFIEAVQKQPELQARLQAWWETLIQTVDITPLLADFGFAPRTAFVSELLPAAVSPYNGTLTIATSAGTISVLALQFDGTITPLTITALP